MPNSQEQVAAVIAALPDDSSFAEIVRESPFTLMIERGLVDAEAGRVISNVELQQQITSWSSKS